MKHLAAFLVPFARSIGFLFGLGLWALLGRRVAGRHSPLGRLVFSPGLGVPEAFACAVGHLGSTKPLLDWSVKPIIKTQTQRGLACKTGSVLPLWHLWASIWEPPLSSLVFA